MNSRFLKPIFLSIFLIPNNLFCAAAPKESKVIDIERITPFLRETDLPDVLVNLIKDYSKKYSLKKEIPFRQTIVDLIPLQNSLVVGLLDGTLSRYDLTDNNLITLSNPNVAISSLIKVGNKFVAGYGHNIEIWSDYGMIPVNLKNMPMGLTMMVSLAPISNELFVSHLFAENNINVYNSNGKFIKNIGLGFGLPTMLLLFPLSNNRFASIDHNTSEIKIWDVESGRGAPLPKVQKKVMSIIEAKPNLLIIAGDNRIYSKDLDTNLEKLIGIHNGVSSLTLLPNGFLVSGGKNKKIKVWNLAGELIQTIDCDSAVQKLITLPNGDFAATLESNKILIFSLQGFDTVSSENSEEKEEPAPNPLKEFQSILGWGFN